MRRSFQTRIQAILCGANLAFMALVAVAYLWMLGIERAAEQRVTLEVIPPFFVAETGLVLALLTRMLRPVARWLATDPAAPEHDVRLRRAVDAVDRTPAQFGVLFAITWYLFPLGATVVVLRGPDWPPLPPSAVTASALAGVATFSAALVLGGTLLDLLLAPLAGRLSLSARARGLTLVRSGPSLASRVVVIVVATVVAPTSLLAAAALMTDVRTDLADLERRGQVGASEMARALERRAASGEPSPQDLEALVALRSTDEQAAFVATPQHEILHGTAAKHLLDAAPPLAAWWRGAPGGVGAFTDLPAGTTIAFRRVDERYFAGVVARAPTPSWPRALLALIVVCMLTLLWALMSASVVARAVVRPIAGVGAAVVRIARDVEVRTKERVPIHHHDETGSLAEGVNEMVDRTAASAARLRDAVAEKQRRVDELDARCRLLELVVDNAPTGIVLVRVPGFVGELVNRSYLVWASGRRSVLGTPVFQVWPEIAETLGPILEGVVASGQPYRAIDQPFRIRRGAPGELEQAWFSFALVPLQTDGRVDGVLGVGIDTTRQVEARRRISELAELAQRRASELEAMLASMLDGVCVCDAEGHVTVANEAELELFAAADREELGRLLEPLEPPGLETPDGRPLLRRELALMRALRGEIVVQHEAVIRRRRAARHLRTSAAPMRDAQGKIIGAVSVSRDVTEQIELERGKEQFFSVAAHELKTPVTVMKGFAEALLGTSAALTPAQRRMLEAIDRGADRIDRIVVDLLDLSKLDLGRLELVIERVDLAELVRGVAGRLARGWPEHRVQVRGVRPAVVRGDRVRLEQILANLVDNALRYSPEGGEVTVTINVQARRAVVAVEDRGIGIPKAQQLHIFERFYRAHADTPYDRGGMGVGLYLSRQMALRHGGAIWFESVEGRGSTFYLSLPLGEE